MLNLHIFAVTLTLLTGLFLFLVQRVALLRRDLKIPYATQTDNPTFMAALSAQHNFVDYTAYGTLLLLILLQMQVGQVIFTLLCLLLVVGRYVHAYGILYMEQATSPSRLGRVIGMFATLSSITLSTLTILLVSFSA